MHYIVEDVLKKLYVIRRLAKEDDNDNIATLAYLAIRELEDLKGEVLDLNTWLANHQGLFSYPFDDVDDDDDEK